MHYVYFAKSQQDNSVYVGLTENVKARIRQHNLGKTKSLKSKLPVILIYFEAYFDKTIARKREIRLKKSWKTKEEILIRLGNK